MRSLEGDEVLKEKVSGGLRGRWWELEENWVEKGGMFQIEPASDPGASGPHRRVHLWA